MITDAQWLEGKRVLATRWPYAPEKYWGGLVEVLPDMNLDGVAFVKACRKLALTPTPDPDSARPDPPPAPWRFRDLCSEIAEAVPGQVPFGDLPACDFCGRPDRGQPGDGYVLAMRLDLVVFSEVGTRLHHSIWMPPDVDSIEALSAAFWPADVPRDVNAVPGIHGRLAVVWNLQAPFRLRCTCQRGRRYAEVKQKDLPTLRPMAYDRVLVGQPVPISVGDRWAKLHRSIAECWGYPQDHRLAGYKPSEVDADADLRRKLNGAWARLGKAQAALRTAETEDRGVREQADRDAQVLEVRMEEAQEAPGVEEEQCAEEA